MSEPDQSTIIPVFVGWILGMLSVWLTEFFKGRRSRFDKLQNIVTELEENQSLLGHVNLAGGRAHPIFLNDAWNLGKGELEILPSDLQKSLLETYSSVAKFNSVLQHEIHGPTGGSYNDTFEKFSKEIRTGLDKCKPKLKDWIEKNRSVKSVVLFYLSRCRGRQQE